MRPGDVVPRKIGSAPQRVNLPEGFPVIEEVDAYNIEADAFRSLPPLDHDPMQISDFSTYFNATFDRLRTRHLLHKRRAKLLRSDGPIKAVINAKIAEIKAAVKRRREEMVDALVVGDNERSKSKVNQGPRDPVEQSADDCMKWWTGFGKSSMFYSYSDEQAAEKCEALLRETFRQFVVCSDL